MSRDFDLDSYNTVPDRMAEFFAKYPEGSFAQTALDFREVNGTWWVIYTAAAYRSPDDPRPGHGTAWEPVPGRTPFTRDSELQNAETAAWGRAVVAVGAADTRKNGVASREEVRNRRAEPQETSRTQLENEVIAAGRAAGFAELDTLRAAFVEWSAGQILDTADDKTLRDYLTHLKTTGAAA